MKVFLLIVLLAAGCGQEDIRVYTVSKESPEPPSEPAQLTWKLPEGWKENPPSEFRVASFKVEDKADVSVVPLPGAAGGDLSNVNRWRGQVELPPYTGIKLQEEARLRVHVQDMARERLSVAGERDALADIADLFQPCRGQGLVCPWRRLCQKSVQLAQHRAGDLQTVDRLTRFDLERRRLVSQGG